MEKTLTTSSQRLAATARSAAQPAAHTDGHVASDHRDASQRAFSGAAIGMSWQLAIIVLVPIIGGYKLDAVTGRSPLCTLAGLVIGLVGSILVVRRALSTMNNFDVPVVTNKDDA